MTYTAQQKAEWQAVRDLGPRKYHTGDLVYCPFMGHYGRVEKYELMVFRAEDGTPVPIRRVYYWLDHWRTDRSWEDCLELIHRKAELRP